MRSHFFDDKFRVNADFTFRNTDNNREQKRVPVPYSNFRGVTAYVGTTTNDLLADLRETRYWATNIYAEYENRFGDNHYLKAMAGYNYEQSTYNRVLLYSAMVLFSKTLVT
ncbi:hypothetical protein KRR40_41590 [Niabella defluvii]|nr:hypothetical protein KRR40_41590 [Niabella sp. I65]